MARQRNPYDYMIALPPDTTALALASGSRQKNIAQKIEPFPAHADKTRFAEGFAKPAADSKPRPPGGFGGLASIQLNGD